MTRSWKTWTLTVNAETRGELAEYLETIADMILEGYGSGIEAPTTWDLIEGDEE